jgi:hypothetical protein
MPFSGASHDPATLAIMRRAFDDAWREIQIANTSNSAGDLPVTRKMMELRIMHAASNGERNPERLRRVAFLAVDGRDWDRRS